MFQLVIIAIGGAAGTLARYGVSSSVYLLLGRSFPYGTLSVNVFGSFMMGFLSVYLAQRYPMASELRDGLLIGFLGAFTTFSAFSIETLALLEQGAYDKALLNCLLSVFICIAAVWLGIVMARSLT